MTPIPRRTRFLGLSETCKMANVWDIQARKTINVRYFTLDAKRLVRSTYKQVREGFRNDRVENFYEFDFKSKGKNMLSW